MLLTDNGVRLSSFDAAMARLLGGHASESGAQLLLESAMHQHKRVELWDWFYLLLKADEKTAVRRKFIESLGMDVGRFINDVEAAFDLPDECRGCPPTDLVSASVSPMVQLMLDRAEAIARDHQCPNVSDLEVTLALLEHAGEDMTEFFADVLDREEDGLGRFKKALLTRIRERANTGETIHIFESLDSGKLRPEVFSGDGWTFCRRWHEDMQVLGIKTKVTTRHLLYSILGHASGPLPSALSVSGVEVQDLRAALTRELRRPGRKRNDAFQLTRDTLFDSVVQVLLEAARLSKAREAKAISETDIHRAFLARQEHELHRLLPKHGIVNLVAVADYLEEEQAEDELPIQRYTIPEIQERINATIFGQNGAVARVMPWIKRLRFGFPREGRPAAVLLFIGPCGTGMTQLAKELARYVYGDEDKMLFLEMGLFNTRESMHMIIGAPPGYVGYGEGKLTNGLRDQPECVVLFDGIEQADPTVFDAVLRFTDEGKIVDPAGPVRDGRKCIIILTSNAGQSWLRAYIKEHPEAQENPDMLVDQLLQHAMREYSDRGFSPEFLGRVDERITFLPFSLSTCRQITDAILRKELAKFSELKGVTIEVPDNVRDMLAKSAHERSMDEGARGAARIVNKHIVSPAIDFLSDYLDRDGDLPRRVFVRAFGIDQIVLEAE